MHVEKNTPAIATADTGAPDAPLPLSNVTSHMGELREREDRNKNVIFFRVKMDGDNQHSINNILANKLHLTSLPDSVVRLRTVSARGPALILTKFNTDVLAWFVIRSEKKLRSLTNADIKANVFISPNYTKLEKTEQYNLRVKLRRRKAACEPNVIIRNGKIFSTLYIELSHTGYTSCANCTMT